MTAGGVGALLCLLGGAAREGACRWRAGAAARRLDEGDWVRLLGGLLLFAFLLSLGPTVHANGRRLGGGLYAWLYPYLFPLRAIRSPTRFGILVLFAIALLAGFGIQRLEARLGPRRRVALVALVVLLLLGEYASGADRYVRVQPRAVDAVLAAEPADVAVLEWPLGAPAVDVDAEFRSLHHGKRVVNGFAAFATEFHRDLAATLAGAPVPLGTEASQAALRAIYPLRYLLVRNADLSPEERRHWIAFRAAPPPLLRFRGTFADVDLYDIRATPEAGSLLRRVVSYEVLVGRPVLHLVLGAEPGPAAGAGGALQSVSVFLNDRLRARIPLRDTATAEVRLDAPLHRAAPNVITLVHGVEHPPPRTRFPVGATGATLAGHLSVRSGGEPYGNLASIRLDGVELAAGGRGYALVALTPDGGIVAREVFDTFADGGACSRISAWVDRLPAGAVVAGAVRDEASGRLCPEGVAALGRVGVAGDLRGRLRESHAFVGAKGAAPGQALEVLGRRLAEVEVGRPIGPESFELRALELTPDRTEAAGPRR